MLSIPYQTSPLNACSLACATMISRYYFPDMSIEDVAQISGWHADYVLWSYQFWLWMMDHGIKVSDIDLIDMESWAKNGVAGLQQSVPEKEFIYMKTHTYNLEDLTEYVQKVHEHPLFAYNRRKPAWKDLTQAIGKNIPVEVVLESYTLDRCEKGFALHRVVVLDITDTEVIFHDPRPQPRAFRKEPIDHFKKAWLVALNEPELCVYEKISR